MRWVVYTRARAHARTLDIEATTTTTTIHTYTYTLHLLGFERAILGSEGSALRARDTP